MTSSESTRMGESAYAEKDLENDEDKTESQQTYQGAVEPYVFEPRADDNVFAEAVQRRTKSKC